MSNTTIASVIPQLICHDAAAAIDFYTRAFGAREELRLPNPDGRLMHACISLGSSRIFLADEMPEVCNRSPRHYGGTPVSIQLVVTDADAAAATAVEAGAEVVLEVAEQFWGDRYGVVRDPFGHEWAISQPGNTLTSQEELEKELEKAMPTAPAPS